MTNEETQGRPSRPTLNAPHIAQMALALIDAEGLDAFSMRKLGAALEVDPMAVYHYFPNKAALLDAIVEAIYTQIDTSVAVAAEWDEAVATYMHAMRNAMRAHPHALSLVATRPVNTAPVLVLVEVLVARLTRAGAAPTEALAMVNCFGTFTIGHLLADVGAPVGGPEGPPPDATILDASAIPTLAAAMAAGWVFDPDAQFDLGLRAMIAGFGAHYGLRDPN